MRLVAMTCLAKKQKKPDATILYMTDMSMRSFFAANKIPLAVSSGITGFLDSVLLIYKSLLKPTPKLASTQSAKIKK